MQDRRKRRNRDRIIAAAREVFAEQGLDASTNEVARRAEVGVATLFRGFATREELIAATFAEPMDEYAELIESALADPDPWQGFCDHVTAACAMQVGDRGFTEVVTQSFPKVKGFESTRANAFKRSTLLVSRAKAAGGLRQDFVAEDFPLVLMANAGVVTATGTTAPQSSPRLVAYLLRAFAAPGAEPLPEPPSPRQMVRSLLRLQRGSGHC